MKRSAAIGLAALIAAAGHAQVVINEVFQNPPGSVDPQFEYIEFYGIPGTKLDGFIIALVNGGQNPFGANPPAIAGEIDEAFSLDGLVIPASGILVIYNDTGGPSFIPGDVAAANPDSVAIGWTQLHIPSIDTPGNLQNDGSSTYILLRNRPLSPDFPFGTFWRKDVQQDPFFVGQFTFGAPFQPNTPVHEPFQMADDVAWSHRQGKEYTRSREQKISDTPGFNPDAISRIFYFGQNPNRGWRFSDAGNLRPTFMADEEWVYGDILNNITFEYEAGRVKGPTDQNGPGYSGGCDPDRDPNCLPDAGPYLFDDIDLTGFRLTPGDFNDAAGITQFRFVRGDFNFDGVADGLDYRIIHAHFRERLNQTPGVTLDEMVLKISDNGTPNDPSDDFMYMGWKFEGRDLQAVLAMMNMDTLDGAGGTGNAEYVTPADIRAAALALCIADLTSTSSPGAPGYLVPDGVIDADDFFTFLQLFATGNALADITGSSSAGSPDYLVPDGVIDADDFFTFLQLFAAGCN